jgi:hypothetical protein
MFKSYEDQQKFEIWAFGHTPTIYGLLAMHSWNSHHGNLLFLEEDNSIELSLNKMYKLYEKELAFNGSK